MSPSLTIDPTATFSGQPPSMASNQTQGQPQGNQFNPDLHPPLSATFFPSPGSGSSGYKSFEKPPAAFPTFQYNDSFQYAQIMHLNNTMMLLQNENELLKEGIKKLKSDVENVGPWISVASKIIMRFIDTTIKQGHHSSEADRNDFELFMELSGEGQD